MFLHLVTPHAQRGWGKVIGVGCPFSIYSQTTPVNSRLFLFSSHWALYRKFVENGVEGEETLGAQ